MLMPAYPEGGVRRFRVLMPAYPEGGKGFRSTHRHACRYHMCIHLMRAGSIGGTHLMHAGSIDAHVLQPARFG